MGSSHNRALYKCSITLTLTLELSVRSASNCLACLAADSFTGKISNSCKTLPRKASTMVAMQHMARKKIVGSWRRHSTWWSAGTSLLVRVACKNCWVLAMMWGRLRSTGLLSTCRNRNQHCTMWSESILSITATTGTTSSSADQQYNNNNNTSNVLNNVTLAFSSTSSLLVQYHPKFSNASVVVVIIVILITRDAFILCFTVYRNGMYTLGFVPCVFVLSLFYLWLPYAVITNEWMIIILWCLILHTFARQTSTSTNAPVWPVSTVIILLPKLLTWQHT